MGFRFFLLGQGPQPNGLRDFSTGSETLTQWVFVSDPMGPGIFLLGRRPRPNRFRDFSIGLRTLTQWVFVADPMGFGIFLPSPDQQPWACRCWISQAGGASHDPTVVNEPAWSLTATTGAPNGERR